MADLMAGTTNATALPLLLRELHRAHPVGAEVRLALGAVADPVLRNDLVTGGGFDTGVPLGGALVRAGVTAVRARTLPDTVAPGMRLLCVGLNPSVYSADAGVGFARPGNRFWPAALAAGIVAEARDPLAALVDHAVGMTDLVKRATPRADELAAAEYAAGVGRLGRLCAWLRPAAVCIVGLSGWRAAVDRKATAGWQDGDLGGSPVYVMPNPSGLNAHSTVADLADHLRRAASGPA